MQSLPQYVLLALGLIANLCLFLSLKREVLKQGRKHLQAIDRIAACLKELAERESPARKDPPAMQSERTQSLHTEALRLWRSGEDVAQIAAALGVPYKELELWLRVQRMVAEQPAGTSAIKTTPT